MSEEELISMCENLNEHVSKLIINEPEIKDGVNISKFTIGDFIEVYNECNGFVRTDNPTIQESFHKLIIVVKDITNAWRTLADREKNILKELQKFPADRETLVNLCNFYPFYQKKLIENYQQVIDLTEKIMEATKQK